MNLITNCGCVKFIQFLNKTGVLIFILIFPFSGNAQDNDLVQLNEQFIRYQENALQEKIFVHTSKDGFFSGETMFFKIYVVDGMLHRPLSLNVVAYLEIINRNNEPVAQLKVPLNNGTGVGSLIIPDSLTTNRYKIISYTSWMRNFSEDYFFAKEIKIINPFKPQISNTEKENGSDKSFFRFFPEGGNLVVGLKSKIAFQGTDLNGKGLNFTGHVINDFKDTVASFQSFKFGIGNFYFTPEVGKKYKALIKTNDDCIIEDLPDPYDEGYVMSLQSELNGEKIRIDIRTNLSNVAGQKIYLFIHNRGRVRNLMTSLIDNMGIASFVIPYEEIEEGISHLTLFSGDLRPIAERLYFKNPSQLLSINIADNKIVYNNRELVKLDLTTNEPANLSLAVFKVDDIQNYDSVNIVNYLLLTSDLKGKIENPAYYVEQNNTERFEATNNLMMTHGWSRFKWQDIIKNNWPVLTFNPDSEGMTIRAKITDELDAPLPNANVFLSVLSNGSQFYAANSTNSGMLQFYTHDLYDKNEMTFQLLGADHKKFNITLLNPFSRTFPSYSIPPFKIANSQENLLKSYMIHNQIQKIFFTKPQASPHLDSIPFFGIPDKTYLLNEYVQFPQVNDVLKEYVPEVIVRKHEKKVYLYTLNKATQTFFESEPFILLDGVPVFNTERIVSLPSNQVRELDIISSRFYSGIFTFNGILSFKTYAREFSGLQLNPEAIVIDYDGLKNHQEFYSPLPAEDDEDRLPDFRNLLLWEPNINTYAKNKSTIAFSTSNLKGNYVGIINGLSSSGKPGHTTFSIKVK